VLTPPGDQLQRLATGDFFWSGFHQLRQSSEDLPDGPRRNRADDMTIRGDSPNGQQKVVSNISFLEILFITSGWDCGSIQFVSGCLGCRRCQRALPLDCTWMSLNFRGSPPIEKPPTKKHNKHMQKPGARDGQSQFISGSTRLHRELLIQLMLLSWLAQTTSISEA